MALSSIEVAIIGAGPYGLSIAAYLQERGVEYRVFGTPMQFWSDMPGGMFLKSFDFATNIYTPQPHFTFREYCQARNLPFLEPIEIADFARYGVWAQQRLALHVEPVNVTMLRAGGAGFDLTLENGEQAHARQVVVAVGLSYFEKMPDVFAGLPRELASHTSQHRDFAPFKGKRVAVIGGGQSALQAAALLHEQGAMTELFVRKGVWWSGRMPAQRTLRDQILYPNTVLGPGRANWVLEHLPMGVSYLPTERRLRFVKKHLGPAGAWWLRDRVEGVVPLHDGCAVVAASADGAGVTLRLRDASGDERETYVDHVVAGTGFAADLERVAFIEPSLVRAIAQIERSPALDHHFQSSVEGLYFVGPISMLSFGPLFRFVAGAAYTAPTVARQLARRRLGRSAAQALEPAVAAREEPVAVAARGR